MRLALGAIVKNEAPYLIDWLAWHQALGFTDFIIADNDSTDGTSEILRALERAGMLTHLKFPSRFHKRPQYDAYDHLCRRLSGRADWLALIDADEFIMPETSDDDLVSLLQDMPGDTGAVALNWALFGSGGHLRAQDEPVFRRFQMRARKSNDTSNGPNDTNNIPHVNQHYKTIIRPHCYAKRIINPHHPKLRDEFCFRRPNGDILNIHQHGISTHVDWSRFRINHYTIKSWSEFIQKKHHRGLADRPSFTCSIAHFKVHDLNEEPDASAQSAPPKFEACKENILRSLGEDRRVYDASVQSIVAFLPPVKPDTFNKADAILMPQTHPPGINLIARPFKRMKLRIIEAAIRMRIVR